MLRLGDLVGRAVIDMNAAEKVGEVDEIVLDPDQCMVAALVVVRGRTFLGGGTERLIPASEIHSIGADAVTINGSGHEGDGHDISGLPRRRDIVDRKVVGHSGAMHGHIDDVLVDPANGRIIGYALDEGAGGGLDAVLGNQKTKPHKYLRAEADLRVGPEIIVVPDDAIVAEDPETAADETRHELDGSQGRWGQGHGTVRETSVWRRGEEPVEPVEPAFEEMRTPEAAQPEAIPAQDEGLPSQDWRK